MKMSANEHVLSIRGANHCSEDDDETSKVGVVGEYKHGTLRFS